MLAHMRASTSKHVVKPCEQRRKECQSLAGTQQMVGQPVLLTTPLLSTTQCHLASSSDQKTSRIGQKMYILGHIPWRKWTISRRPGEYEFEDVCNQLILLGNQ